MARSTRLFEIIQLLRGAEEPLTAMQIGELLEVHKRTVYRDIAALQAMRVPIEGAAGIGYVMRRGYDLPPLMFTADELEAIVVGLSMLGRTTDLGLQAAAVQVGKKIASMLPKEAEVGLDASALPVSPWNAIPPATADYPMLRRAIRQEQKLQLEYVDEAGCSTARTVRPLAVVYYIDSIILAAWCELRNDFRHFRTDRITACCHGSQLFKSEGNLLRQKWRDRQELFYI